MRKDIKIYCRRTTRERALDMTQHKEMIDDSRAGKFRRKIARANSCLGVQEISLRRKKTANMFSKVSSNSTANMVKGRVVSQKSLKIQKIKN